MTGLLIAHQQGICVLESCRLPLVRRIYDLRVRSRGVRLGRPIAQAQPDEVAVLKQQGLSLPEIAERLRCSRSTVKRRLREAGPNRAEPTQSPCL